MVALFLYYMFLLTLFTFSKKKKFSTLFSENKATESLSGLISMTTFYALKSQVIRATRLLPACGCSLARRGYFTASSFFLAARGDIQFAAPLLERMQLTRRESGILRGARHSSQATEPETGKLCCRASLLHSVGPPSSSSTSLTPIVASWAYLMPSLRRAAEKSAEDPVHGQRQFLYELGRRLPLLEDSLAEAELKYVVMWPSLLRTAGVRLSKLCSGTTLVPTHDSEGGKGLHCVALSKESTAFPRSLGARLLLLHNHVVEIVEEELLTQVPMRSTKPMNRAQKRKMLMLDQWKESMQWVESGCGE